MKGHDKKKKRKDVRMYEDERESAERILEATVARATVL
jgi:hypothetical protein